MKRFILPFLAVIALLPFLNGCAPIATEPDTGWKEYVVREGVEYNDAWNTVIEVLLKYGYQFETLSKDDGYIKTEYQQEIVESLGVEVRTRIAIKFSGHRTVRMKVDEDYIVGYKEQGTDLPRIKDLKDELLNRLF